MINSNSREIFEGFALYCSKNKPLGIISPNADKQAICNKNTIPIKIKKCLVEIEDQRFYSHGAVDIRSISRALYHNIKSGKIVQGGSTITQQLARNILKDNRKNFSRKVRETKLAFDLESHYSKDEILDLYFNNVFWGKNNYGLRTASLGYFSKEPEQLSTKEQIVLLTLLRGPNYYISNEKLLEKRSEFLSELLLKRKILSNYKYNKIKRTHIKVQNNPLEIFRNSTIPFISSNINENKRTILSTLNNELQRKATSFISACKYPTSIIGVADGKIICLGSSNGSDFPLTYKSNVGSTLKPFIYTILRNGGVQAYDLFRTNTTNTINWDIREVQNITVEFLSLEDALLSSNNNAFVNATFDYGIEKTLLALSLIINKPLNNFVPSSILGATIEGLTLHELLLTYERYFKDYRTNLIKDECISILKKIAIEKFSGEFDNSFLKTGTTNFNKERFAIVGYANKLFGFLRQGNEENDYSKEGGFISNIIGFLRSISRKKYKWD
jgi:membrane peptidoglycan carboxypeptidase